jgi:ankyrin repeat protein
LICEKRKKFQKMQQLVESIKQNNLDKVKQLISTLNINETFKEWDKSYRRNAERTPLQYAVEEGHLEIVQFLLEFGADINKGRIDTDFTPLNSAAYSGHLEI